MTERASEGRGVSLVDVLDRLLEKGVAVYGDVTIALADVELVTLRLQLVLASPEELSGPRLSGVTLRLSDGETNRGTR